MANADGKVPSLSATVVVSHSNFAHVCVTHPFLIAWYDFSFSLTFHGDLNGCIFH